MTLVVAGIVVVALLLASLLCIYLLNKKKRHHPPVAASPRALLQPLSAAATATSVALFKGCAQCVVIIICGYVPREGKQKQDDVRGIIMVRCIKNWQHNGPPPPPSHVLKMHSHPSPQWPPPP